ncbi:MAG: cyclic nucleotide-binding domain-containing protein [Deltaproteobacteria bacterium]|nr:cyclic nucleotide-binding domain-containing protein [Deltaproteobacteria bacterium]
MNSPRESKPTETSNHLDDALTILRRLPVFKNISLEMVRLYAYLSSKELYKKGDIILRQGTASDRLLLIVQGDVSITRTVGDREILLQKLSADSLNYFGELALITEFEWFFSAYAWSDVSILSISRVSFGKVIERYPDTFFDTVAEIVKLRIDRFSHQTDYLIDHLEEKALNRLALKTLLDNKNEQES